RTRAESALRFVGESRVMVAMARSTVRCTRGVSSAVWGGWGRIIANRTFPGSPSPRVRDDFHAHPLTGTRGPPLARYALRTHRTGRGQGPAQPPPVAVESASAKFIIAATASEPSAASLILRVSGSAVIAPV